MSGVEEWKISIMAKTALELTAQERKEYKLAEAIKLRQLDKAEEIKKRRHEAQQLAHKAANLLKREFGAEKVVLFWSLVGDSRFTL